MSDSPEKAQSLVIVYAVRHGLRLPFKHDVSNNKTALSRDGVKQVEEEVAPALQKNISEAIADNPGVPYTLDVIHSPALRAEETALLIVKHLQQAGLNVRKCLVETGLADREKGRYHGLSKAERQAMDPAYYTLYQSDKINIPPPDGESLRTAYDRTREVIRQRQDAVAKDSDKHAAPLHFELIIGHQLGCGTIKKNLVGSKEDPSLRDFRHIARSLPGSINRYSGITMHNMQDEGFIYEGRPHPAKDDNPLKKHLQQISRSNHYSR